MKTNAMNKAVLRGVRRGMRMQSGDLTSIRKMREEIETRSFVAEAWNSTGKSLYTAMGQISPTSRTANSDSSHRASLGTTATTRSAVMGS